MMRQRIRGGCYENPPLTSSRWADPRCRSRLGWLPLLLLVLSCGDHQAPVSAPKPVLSDSRAAQREFRPLEQRWRRGDREERAGLERPLRDFIRRYPADDQSRLARVYLAWILMQRRNLDAALVEVRRAEKGPEGSARDFATVTEAAILIRMGRPEPALALLGPLQGKIIDPLERHIYGEQLMQAALGGRRWRRAIGHMVDWLAQTTREYREEIRLAVTRQLPRIPARALERNLESLDQDATDPTAAPARVPARDWLRKTLRQYLAELALERSDVALARRLLESGPSSLRRGKMGTALVRLAASGAVAARVKGRAVGLVLSLDTAAVRRRSTDLVQGLTRTLGLPAAAAQPGSVRLLTRDDTKASGGMERALAELAGDGAAVLVAGVDTDGARQASVFAEASGIPVMVMHHLPLSAEAEYTFVLGIDFAATEAKLSEALRDGGTELATAGPGGAPCDALPSSAGQPRFPVREWKRQGVGALMLLGDATCARDAIADLRRARLRPRLGFGLSCGELFATIETKLPRLAVAVGDYPVPESGDAPPSMIRWQQATGAPPTWYHALGHDAALLASAALAEFPLQLVDDAREVARLHRRARAMLASTSAALWSSRRAGFEGGQQLQREPRIVSEAAGGGP